MMNDVRDSELDFDHWSAMAKDDPVEFETMRTAAIEAYIGSLPEQNQARLRRLQWRIDQERRIARTPLAACLRISRMMWHNLLGDSGLHERMQELTALLQGERVVSPSSGQRVSAQVLPFACPAADSSRSMGRVDH